GVSADLPTARRAFSEKPDVGRLQFRRLTPEYLEDLVDNAGRVKPGLGIHRGRTVVIDENIRQNHAASLEARTLERARVAQQLHDLRGKSPDRALLDRYEEFMLASQPQNELAIERLGKSSVSDGG